jgi:hypothetical protein
MKYEESLMTPKEKEESEKRSHERLQTLKQILRQHHPEKYIETEMMCEY